MLTTPARYRIRVQGQLGPQWADWFGGFTLSWEEPGETVFVGQIIDQAALHGILNTIRDLRLPRWKSDAWSQGPLPVLTLESIVSPYGARPAARASRGPAAVHPGFLAFKLGQSILILDVKEEGNLRIAGCGMI